MKRGPLLLVEGLDLAGKSMLVHHLEKEIGRMEIPLRMSRNALCRDNPIALLADQLRKDPSAGMVETGALFLSAHCWDARHFVYPGEASLHLQDSCWLRTLAFHRFHETPQIPELLQRASSDFPKFDRVLFLSAGFKERQRRLQNRLREQPDDNDWQDHLVVRDPGQFLALEEQLRRTVFENAEALEVDTTFMRPATICEAALAHFEPTIPG